MYSFLVDDYGKHKKAKGVNKIVVTSHGEYKYILLNQNCLSNSMNWIQSKKNIDVGKIYTLNNGYHGLALRYQS